MRNRLFILHVHVWCKSHLKGLSDTHIYMGCFRLHWNPQNIAEMSVLGKDVSRKHDFRIKN